MDLWTQYICNMSTSSIISKNLKSITWDVCQTYDSFYGYGPYLFPHLFLKHVLWISLLWFYLQIALDISWKYLECKHCIYNDEIKHLSYYTSLSRRFFFSSTKYVIELRSIRNMKQEDEKSFEKVILSCADFSKFFHEISKSIYLPYHYIIQTVMFPKGNLV